MRKENAAVIAGIKQHFHFRGVDGFAKLNFQHVHLQAKRRRQRPRAIRENAANDGQDAVARRKEVNDRRFHSARAGARDKENVAARPEELTSAIGDLAEKMAEVRPPMIDHLPGAFDKDFFRKLSRTGYAQVCGWHVHL